MIKDSKVPGHLSKFWFYRIVCSYKYLLEKLIPPAIKDFRDIPIIINNFNNLSSLKMLIQSLEKRSYRNIIILDNQSTYPPLLEYYGEIKHEVIRLNSNLGMDALWKSGLIKRFRKDYFAYTDPDIVPIDECPDDFLLYFLEILRKYPLASKAGFSLKIDDIPDHYALKEQVIMNESHFFTDYKRDGSLYWAPIDTTFALYRPRAMRRHANNNIEMYRTGFPYMARHTQWYINSSDPDEETMYYLMHVSCKTSWSSKSRAMLRS